MTERTQTHEVDGMAALGICESLLAALTDLKIIGEKDARDLLTDVVTAHSEAARNFADARQASGRGCDYPTYPRCQEWLAAVGLTVTTGVSRQGLTGNMFAPI